MNTLTYALLETDAEPAMPIDIVGWGLIVLALVLTVVWLAYLYR